jgi:hypothetical protein
MLPHTDCHPSSNDYASSTKRTQIYVGRKEVTSIGWLLEAGTDPQRFSGWFLGFITMVLKKSKTQF